MGKMQTQKSISFAEEHPALKGWVCGSFGEVSPSQLSAFIPPAKAGGFFADLAIKNNYEKIIPAGALLCAWILVSFFLISGCTDPNQNLVSGSCCNQSISIYTCTKGEMNKDKNSAEYGLSKLADCGECAWVKDSSAQILDANKQPLLKASGVAYSPNDCKNSCNFKKANCTNQDGQNTCYGFSEKDETIYDTTIRVAPICANATSNPCIQNECKAMMYGEKVPSVRVSMDSKGVSAVADDTKTNTFATSTKEQQSGLVGKVVEFNKMDKKTSRLFKTGDWIANSLRLGVAGTFSDYDRSRFYLPPSDFFCARSNPTAVVDRYTNYLNMTGKAVPGSSCIATVSRNPNTNEEIGKWACARGRTFTYTDKPYLDADNKPMFEKGEGPDGKIAKDTCDRLCLQPTYTQKEPSKLSAFYDPVLGYQARIAYCTIDSTDVLSPFYYCANNKEVKFIYNPADDTSKQIAAESCRAACNPTQFTCGQNVELMTKDLVVSPKLWYEDGKTQPFVDKDNYIQELIKNYPTPAGPTDTSNPAETRDYYKKQVNWKDIEGNVQAAIDEMAKPGPAGAKVFECENNADCLSGKCSKGTYTRSSCFLKDGSSVDCGCTVITNCKSTYNCDQYTADSLQRAQCNANWDFCDWRQNTKDEKITCTYQSESPSVTAGHMGVIFGGRYKGTYWTVKDLSEFNKYLNDGDEIEIMNQQIYKDVGTKCVNLDENKIKNPIISKCVSPEVETPTQCIIYDKDGTTIISSREREGCGTSNDPMGKDRFALMKNFKMWVDDERSYDSDVRWSWEWYSFKPAPDMQVVSGPLGPKVIYTNRKVQWDKSSDETIPLLDKMPLLKACNMKSKKSSDYAGGYKEAMQDTSVDVIEIIPILKDGLEIGDGGNNDHRFDKTWAIKSFGDCQTDKNTGMLVTKSYGVCESCGAVLSMAYQKVDDWATPQGYGYCPTDCLKVQINKANGFSDENNFQCLCNGLDYHPRNTYASSSFGSPKTDPEMGFLMSKIDEYQSSFIMPILDLKNYDTATNFALGGTTITTIEETNFRTKTTCYKMGGTPLGSQCSEKEFGYCVKWKLECRLPGYSDYLLSFLQKNHSASIVIVDSLPKAGTCPGGTCATAGTRLTNAKTVCPDCIMALEYDQSFQPMQISISHATKQNEEVLYNQTLSPAIFEWVGDSAASFPNPQSRGLPKWYGTTPPAKVGDVEVLVLKMDLSQINDAADYDLVINQSINISRHVLQQVGWPTIWKLEYDVDEVKNNAFGSLAQEELYSKLIAQQREMTLAGIVGVLLPPLDNGDQKQIDTSGENGMRLLPATPKKYTVQDTNSPFCAAQEGSKIWLHPKITAGVQKVYAQEKCKCVACSDFEISAGVCTAGSDICMDGTSCDSTGMSAGRYKCTPNCITQQFCENNLCKESTDLAICTAVRSAGEKMQMCSADSEGISSYPDLRQCDIATMKVSEFANELAQPLAPFLIGSLKSTDRCCVKGEGNSNNPNSPSAYYTYYEQGAIRYSAESTIYPAYGAQTTDCGKELKPEDASIPTCGGTTVYPLPISETMWSCSVIKK
ncbi:MAG: hypothetical protein WC492_00900 [Candidatus Micrarchaeia archaeon]